MLGPAAGSLPRIRWGALQAELEARVAASPASRQPYFPGCKAVIVSPAHLALFQKTAAHCRLLSARQKPRLRWVALGMLLVELGSLDCDLAAVHTQVEVVFWERKGDMDIPNIPTGIWGYGDMGIMGIWISLLSPRG